MFDAVASNGGEFVFSDNVVIVAISIGIGVRSESANERSQCAAHVLCRTADGPVPADGERDARHLCASGLAAAADAAVGGRDAAVHSGHVQLTQDVGGRGGRACGATDLQDAHGPHA